MITTVPVLQNTFASGQHDPEELLHHLMAILDEEKEGNKQQIDQKEKENSTNSTSSTTSTSSDRRKESGFEEERRAKKNKNDAEEESDEEEEEEGGNPFYGRLVSSIKCLSCNTERKQAHKFMDISLAIPNTKYPPSLDNCLEHFTSSESLTGVRCDHCLDVRRLKHISERKKISGNRYHSPGHSHSHSHSELKNPSPSVASDAGAAPPPSLGGLRAKLPPSMVFDPYLLSGVDSWIHDPKRNKATKMLVIDKAPGALCLHIQRLVTQAGLSQTTFVKRPDKVQFEPVLQLSKSKACSKESLYSLVAVIVHHGSETSGHFTVYRKLFSRRLQQLASKDYDKFIEEWKENVKTERGDWVHISDEVCRKVEEENVLQAPAYMLFYEKTA
jgi:ubiquitin C-terminal hydrolase